MGNDIVDLALAPAPRERFVARVLGPAERAMFDASAHPAVMLWTLFAAKEAAYKAISRCAGPIVFAHRAFVVAADLREVRWRTTTLVLEIARGGRWVHALAYAPGPAPSFAVSARGERDASQAVRRLVCEHVAPRLGRSPAELEVVRDPLPGSWDGFAPPRLRVRGAALGRVAIGPNTRVSLSHDGGFVACAADLALDLPEPRDLPQRQATHVDLRA